MEVYKWEQSGRAQRKKVKKTGTVVLHADAGVDTQFDRLLKAYPIERQGQQSNTNKNKTDSPEMESDEQSLELQTSPFMTASTAARLRDVFGFTSLLPCQAQCYKGIFKARDVILHSRTGSGKTLAYALPIIERYLLLEKHIHTTNNKEIRKKENKLPREPFLLIFVFSNDLALQTSSVLRKLYPELIIFTAGVGEEVNTITELKSNGADVVIGTIPAIDVLIRGRDAITEEEEQEEQEKADEEMNDDNNKSKSKKNSTLSKHENEKRSRSSEHTSKSNKRTKADKSENNNNNNINKNDTNENDAVVESATQNKNESEKDNEKGKKGSKNIVNKNNKPNKFQSRKNVDHVSLQHKQHYILSARQVRAVVIDEVDVTLGPRFSNMGRRMKNLLHVIRKANGSLTDGLLHDLRRHHYVLCGATIPNWVIKSGFLGVKKYYYSLVEPGREKLPAQLKCYYLPCNEDQRITTATQLLLNSSSSSSSETETSLGRTVVFGSPKQLKELEVALHEAEQNDKINNTSAVNSSSVNISENNKKEENKAGKESSEKIEGVYSTLSQTRLTVERIHKHQTDEERAHALERFNNKQAHILLCTDQASRGLDFVDVTTVLMLSLPHYNMAVETFIHRAGRTARVGRSGQCILLYDPHNKSECELNNAIEKTTHISFQRFVPATQINNTGEVIDEKKVKKHETKSVKTRSNDDSKKQNDKNKILAANTTEMQSNSSTFCLTVRNPFAFTTTQSSYSVSSAPPLPRRVPPTAHQVLQRELNGDLIKRIHIVDPKEMESIVKGENNNSNESSSSEVVYFQCDFNDVALIKDKLWKYDLKEL